jgi:hypothetical protein
MSDFAESLNIVGPSGSTVDVKNNRVLENPKTAFQQAVDDGRAYTFASVTFDPDAHNTILGVYNTDSDQDFHVQTIFASSDTASQIQVFEAAAVTMAGTVVPANNLNRASARVAKATAMANETGNAEQAGGYTKLLFRDLLVANTLKQIDVNGKIVLPVNKMIGVDLTTAATGAVVTITGWFE